jgi:hypothetical protein
MLVAASLVTAVVAGFVLGGPPGAASAKPPLGARPGFGAVSSGELEAAAERLASLDADLRRLEPYVAGEPGAQRLDAGAARRAGATPDLVALAGELVAYQNRLLAAGGTAPTGGGDVREARVPLTDYPRVAAFYDTATLAAAADVRRRRAATPSRATRGPATPSSAPSRRRLDAAAVHPCGDYDHPVPSRAPAKVLSRPYREPARYLRSQGFHHSRGYLCGQSSAERCARDFTRPRGYTSRYGTCARPIFRDQATLQGSSRFRLQLGEPNPEVDAYRWPYWGWGAYVRWWHARY